MFGLTRKPWIFSIAAVLAVSLMTFGTVRPLLAQEGPAPDSDVPILSLDRCIRLGLEESPTLLISGERRQIASKDVTLAIGSFLPTISLGRTWQKAERTDFDIEQATLDSFQVFDNAGNYHQQYFADPNGTFVDELVQTSYQDWNGQARLNVFSGMSKFSSLSSAKNSLAAAKASQGYTRELVVQDITMAYFNVLRYERLLEVAIETRDQAAKELEKTETYFRLGSAAKSDVLQQRVRLENTRLDVVIADNTVNKAYADLAFAMNRPLASGFRVDPTALNTDFAVEDVGSLYAEALTNRLDLVSSEHNVVARGKDVTTASSGFWPSIDLFGNYSRYQNDSPYKFGGQESQSTSWGYTLNWNVFDKFQTVAQRSKAKANERIAKYELDQARLNVQVEIRQLHNNLIEARERAKVSEETIVQSEEELRLAQERFRVGAGTTLDIIVAQANLANSRAQVVTAICDFLIAEAQLKRAVGRLTSAALSPPEEG